MRFTTRGRKARSTRLISARRRAGAAAQTRLRGHLERTRLQRRSTQSPHRKDEAPRALQWLRRGPAALGDAARRAGNGHE